MSNAIQQAKRQLSIDEQYAHRKAKSEQKLVQKEHDTDIKYLKKEQDFETDRLRNDHREKILNEKERVANAIEILQRTGQRTEEEIEKRRQFLQQKENEQLAQVQETGSKKLAHLTEKFVELKDKEQTKHQQGLAELRYKMDVDRQNEMYRLKEGLNQLEEIQTRERTGREKSLSEQTATEMKNAKDQIEQLRTQKKKDYIDEKRIFDHQIDQSQKLAKMELSNQRETWQKTYQNNQKNFEKQFSDQNKTQQSTFKNLEDRFQEQINETKSRTSNVINHISQKADDPFYQIKRPNPTLKDVGDSYEIKLEVPPHEQQSYILSAEKRQLKLSFDRHFKDQLKQDGQELKSSRVESFNYSFPVESIVDSKQISKNYENNILTFRIAKA